MPELIAAKAAEAAPRDRYRGPVTVYAIAQLTIHDRARYQQYVAAFMPVLTQYGGRLLAPDEHGGDRRTVGWRQGRPHAFPDRETFTAWVTSPEYREISKDRLAAAETTGILVRGLR
jgi:uncharacterized protein (DUF1330 family)